MFFRLLPDKTLEFKDILDSHGGKKNKERLTAMVCANMEGTDRLPLLVIGKSANPRCFKNVRSLPVEYNTNKKAWMTVDIFSTWVKQLDKKMKRKKRKTALVIDNCPAHPKIPALQSIELIFLPPNTTSKTQPMDQGIIQNMKHAGFANSTTAEAEEEDDDFDIDDNILLSRLRDHGLTPDVLQQFTNADNALPTCADLTDDDILEEV
ncbi:tigger transposable element-derived protein 6-like [Saccostrea cucullata]|uniref:tigger transposable element-derived protein 6-like n=1 Tax=Saccostrea cuccullata TaxID=36930 RepID=UPI002ED1A4D9